MIELEKDGQIQKQGRNEERRTNLEWIFKVMKDKEEEIEKRNKGGTHKKR